MNIGYIIGGKHTLFQTVDFINKDLNCLIIGYDNALRFYPEANLDNFQLDNNVFFCYNEEESSKERYFKTLNKVGKICFNSFQNGARKIIVKNLSEIVLNKDEIIFYYETDKVITITQGEIIYYLNKDFLFFLGIDFFEIKKSLKDYNVLSVTNDFENINALFKNQLIEFNHIDIIKSYKQYGEIDTYFGYFCLKWISKYNVKLDFTDKGYQVWKRAFWVENLLSQIKILVNDELAEEFNEEIAEQSKGGYIVQKYNGTNKITGRIYANESDFSLQTLSTYQKEIIIAEPRSYLIEFDYAFFEFEILRQICNLDFKGDPHIYTSQLLYGNDLHRKQAKSINYSILYGKSIKKIREELKLIENIDEKLKDFEKLVEKIESKNIELQEFYSNNKYIVNHFGRKIQPTEKYKCLNNFVQSTAADHLILKILKISELLSSYNPLNRIVLQNHDSILLNLREVDIEEHDLASKIKIELELPEENIKAKTSLKFGKNWKEME